MTDDDLDIDVNTNEEQAAEPAAKPSLKEAWESSPMLKIAAVVLGVAVLAGVYLTFFSGDKAGAGTTRTGPDLPQSDSRGKYKNRENSGTKRRQRSPHPHQHSQKRRHGHAGHAGKTQI